MKTDSAHRYRSDHWACATPTSKWATAEPEVLALAATLPTGARILHLGAGLGRHALAFAGMGFDVAAVVARAVAEIASVLKPGGSFIVTMLSTRRLAVERGQAPGHEISPGTWVFDGPGDKVHPHVFCDARDLLALFAGFEVRSLVDREHDTPGSWHWHLLAERTA